MNFKEVNEATMVIARLVLRVANEPERIALGNRFTEVF
jgi:hypothetical protein